MDLDQFALGVLWYVVFLLSTTCHEAAHALVSHRGGDSTAAEGGQVSLNPLPHIRREVFGMVIFPLLSFATAGWMMGWASAPYDRRWAHTYPRRAAAMALAGPAANLVLCILAGILIRIGLVAGVFSPPEFLRFSQVAQGAEGFPEGAAIVLSILFSLNVLLCVFNLLPIPPLDGWSAVGLLLPESGARRLGQIGQRFGMFSIIGLLIAWQFFGHLYRPIFRFATLAVYGLLG
jgi:Zn-dependent protease